MKREMMPTWEELERHRQIIAEINPAAVIAMLGIKQAAERIQHSIMDVLQREYHLSEGKFCALVVLHQNNGGMAPSQLAEKVGVTRATISNMLQRLERDGLASVESAPGDGRSKVVRLTEKGRDLMQEVLPPHYLRVTKLLARLDEAEQKELIHLLKKMETE